MDSSGFKHRFAFMFPMLIKDKPISVGGGGVGLGVARKRESQFKRETIFVARYH